MEFESIFKYPPKNAWTAVLTQLLCWSFRRFCIELLNNSELEIWDTYFTLITEYAPPQFQPHLEHWLAPEQIVHIPDLSAYFHTFIDKLNESIEKNDEETQDKIATFLDEDMSPLIEKWLGQVYAPFSLFPSSTDPDTSIDMTKLNAIVYLLKRQPSLSRGLRKTRSEKRDTTLRKTRRNKQHDVLQLYLRPEIRDRDAKAQAVENDEGEREERKGDEERHSEEERHDEGENYPSHKEGNS